MLSRRILLCAGLVLTVSPLVAADRFEDSVWAAIVTARAEDGAPPLVRDPELDAVAAARAAELAHRPASTRMARRTPLEDALAAAGYGPVVRARERVDFSRGASSPARWVIRRWRDSSSWKTALDSGMRRAGLAAARADDGWLVFFALFVEPLDIPEDLDTWALRAEALVNEQRARHGLEALARCPELLAVAVGHSEEMAREGRLSHIDPEGRDPAERARAAGIRFRLWAENIASNRGVADPVRTAVEGWMKSEGHRRNILDGRLVESAIGVALAGDGTVYFTQVFRRPLAEGE